MLPLAGCGVGDYFDQHPFNVRAPWESEPAPAPAAASGDASPAPQGPAPTANDASASPAATAPQSASSDAVPTAQCESVAKARAGDAANAGFEDDVQQKVHDQTYAKCVAWYQTHGGG
jgi:hypothetical protein